MSDEWTYLADITPQPTLFDDVSGFSVGCWVIAVVALVIAGGVAGRVWLPKFGRNEDIGSALRVAIVAAIVFVVFALLGWATW